MEDIELTPNHAKGPLTFRIYPNGKWLYAVVNIWPNKKSMQAHMKVGRGYTAICTPMERLRNVGGKWRKTGQFCEINFHRRQIGIGVVSHEMTHAAFSWAARRRISSKSAMDTNVEAHAGIWDHEPQGNTILPDNDEEHIALTVGRLCNQFTRKCYDLGLYKEVIITK